MINNPWQDSHRKGAGYTRVEVGREYSPFGDSSKISQALPSWKHKATETGFHALDVREQGLTLLTGSVEK